jgi:dihydrofolate reductase
MGKLVVTEFLSVDGVYEDPGGADGTENGGWTFRFDRGEEGNRFKLDELMAADAQLLGRTTYEGFARAWPTMQGTGAFGEKMNAMPKYVVSATLRQATWASTTIIRKGVTEEVRRLKARYDGDILVAGSGQLVRTLMADGLIDEIRLMIFPVVLGRGKRLFEAAPMTNLRLAEVKPVGPAGVIVVKYASAVAS